jgi:hypothetical protein
MWGYLAAGARFGALLLEDDLFRKPVPIPDQVEDMLFGIMLYSTVTDFARLRGWSTSVPICTAVW